MFAVGGPRSSVQMEQAQFPYPANTAKGQKQTHKKGLTPKADWRSFPLLSHFFHCLRGLGSKVFISNKRNRQPQLLNTGAGQPLLHRDSTLPHRTRPFKMTPWVRQRGHKGEPLPLQAGQRCLPRPAGQPGPSLHSCLYLQFSTLN